MKISIVFWFICLGWNCELKHGRTVIWNHKTVLWNHVIWNHIHVEPRDKMRRGSMVKMFILEPRMENSEDGFLKPYVFSRSFWRTSGFISIERDRVRTRHVTGEKTPISREFEVIWFEGYFYAIAVRLHRLEIQRCSFWKLCRGLKR